MSAERPRGERFCLYDTAALQAVLDRMAAQAATYLAGEADPLLLGILRRGMPLAEMLQERLKRKHGLDLPCYGLRLKRYADDLTLLHPETELTENAEFSARDLSRRGASAVRIAVLADRCVAALPIRANIVGVKLQIAAGDIVECHVPPYEDGFRIELLRPSLA
jgi:pyrimidine operon attenuation protein/uracil phosphoribosyltransferase